MIILLFAFSSLFISTQAEAQNCDGSFRSSNEFYRCAIQRDARISSLVSRKSEREGRESAARQIPNPHLEAELGFGDDKQQNISITQPIEIGGKRSARIKVAEAENLASTIEDEVAMSEATTELATSLVRFRQLTTQDALLGETKNSLINLIKRLRAKAVRTPEERNAISIFTMQNTILDTELLAVKQELKEVQAELEAAIGRKLSEGDQLMSPEKRDWPSLDPSKVGETSEAKLSRVLAQKASAEVNVQESLGWPELAVGPMMEKQAGSETSWGAKIELSLPFFNVNGGEKQRSRAEFQRAETLSQRTRLKETSNLKTLFEQYNDTGKFLKNSPSQSEIKKSVTESLQLFARGMIQPSTIVETYRSSLETLKAVQEKELAAYRLYWRLRSYSGDVPKEFL